MSLGIINGLVYQNGKLVSKNILIDKGKILKISSGSITADTIVNAKGKAILPGAIDTHVHFRDFAEKSKEDWTTGSSAAVSGGVTTVLDMPNNSTPISTEKLLHAKIKLASNKSVCNFGCYMIVNNQNIDEVNSVKPISAKLYMGMTTGGNTVENLDEIFKKLDKNVFLVVHAEDNNCMGKNEKKYKNADNPVFHTLIRDNACEEIAIKRIIHIAKKHKRQVHIAHLSTVEGLRLIVKAKKEKVKITCEVCPHHLFLDIGDYKVLQNYGRMNPSLKYGDDAAALLDGILNGSIDTITTDHAPHLKKDKEKPYASSCSGVTGVETMVPLLLDLVSYDELPLKRMVELVSEMPAKLFGIKNKGKIKEGFDADLMIVDFDLEKEVQNKKLFTKCKWSPFHGWNLKGWPVITVVNGNVVFDHGKVNKIFGKSVDKV